MFESNNNDARFDTPEPHSESNVERVSETSQDVALINSEQTLVGAREKSTSDKVRFKYQIIPNIIIAIYIYMWIVYCVSIDHVHFKIIGIRHCSCC